jgi:hypothetical protein
MMNLTSNPHLFVDETLVMRHDGTSLRLHQPQREGIALMTDEPWEGPMSGYFTVIDAGDTYLLYYRGTSTVVDTIEEVTCVAESDDGIEWRRRKTWQYTLNGSRANNVVWANERLVSHNMAPFLDSNPDAPEDTRFKAIGGIQREGVFILGSSDGFSWRLLNDTPVMTEGDFDSLNLAFWDSRTEQYVAYIRQGRDGIRSVRRCLSDDFINWSDPEWLEFGPGTGAPNADPSLEQFYTNAIQPYDRDPGLYLGFPKRFVLEHTRIPGWHGGIGASDCVFIASRDGLNFPRRFREAFIRPGLDQMNWNERNMMMSPGMIRTSPTEYSLYWTEHYRRHDAHLVRGTIRVDGFASLHADYPGGEMTSVPVELAGGSLVLNMSTSAAGSVRVEIQDENGAAIDGYGLDDCEELFGDEIDRVVTWNGSPELGRLHGETLRLRIAIVDADLFSIACV